MTTRSKSNQFTSRTILLTVFAALVTAGPALPQSDSSSGNAVKDPGGYSKVDLTGFFGTQWFQLYQGPQTGDQHFLSTKPVVGERVRQGRGGGTGATVSAGVG